MAFTTFIPTIWSARLLAHLDKAHVYANLVNRDYEGEIKNFGDKVKINQIGDITIKNYTKNTDIAAPDAVDGNNAQSNPKVMDDAMQRAAYGMNDVTDGFLAGLMAVGAINNGTNLGSDATPLVPTATTAYDMLVDLATDLTEKNVPMAGRWVVVPAWFHGLLLKDQRFVGNGTDYNKALIEGGEVGVAAGFAVNISNNVPATTTTVESVTTVSKYKILAGTRAATSYAEQILKTEAYRPEKRFSDAIKGLHVYGAKVVQGKSLSVLTVNRA